MHGCESSRARVALQGPARDNRNSHCVPSSQGTCPSCTIRMPRSVGGMLGGAHGVDEGPARSGWLKKRRQNHRPSQPWSPGSEPGSEPGSATKTLDHPSPSSPHCISPFHPISSPILPPVSPPYFPPQTLLFPVPIGGEQPVSARKSSVGFPSAALVSPALLRRSESPASRQKSPQGLRSRCACCGCGASKQQPCLDPSSDPWTPTQHWTSPEPENSSEFSPSLTTSPHFSQTEQSHRCDVHRITRRTRCGSRQGEQLERRTRAHPIPALLSNRIP